MHIVHLNHKPTNSAAPVLKMRMRDHGEVQFYAYVRGEWQWVDTDEFGGPVPPQSIRK